MVVTDRGTKSIYSQDTATKKVIYPVVFRFLYFIVLFILYNILLCLYFAMFACKRRHA